MMEALRSSEVSVPIKATRRNTPEDDSLHIHRREIFKSYITWIVHKEYIAAGQIVNSVMF
jgi:hypothetical protein